MSNKALDTFNGLPGWAKGVIAVAGLGIAYFAVRGIMNRIKSQADLQKAHETQNTIKSEIKTLAKSGVSPTYPASQYKAWSDAIEKQFAGTDFDNNLFSLDVPILGTWSGSGKMFGNIVKALKNNADFASLVDAYGIRTYDQAGWFTGNFTGNLYQAVNDELDDAEIKALNTLLLNRGITYKF